MVDPTPIIDLVDAVVRVSDIEALRTVLQGPVDVACTSGPRSVSDGYELNLIVTRAHLEVLQQSGLEVQEVTQSGAAIPSDVGTGNRYQGGIIPRGVGDQFGWVPWLLSSIERRRTI